MAVNSRFRTLAFALRNIVTDTYDLLNAVDAVMALDTDLTHEAVREAVESIAHPVITTPDGLGTYDWSVPEAVVNRWLYSHDSLVSIALDTDEVLAEWAASRKINAIKALRAKTKCGLKAAKDACEDSRVGIAANLRNDPWYVAPGSDEPPF